MECRKTRNDCFRDNKLKMYINLKKEYAEKFIEIASIEIQSQHWVGNRQLSMEVISVEYFTN